MSDPEPRNTEPAWRFPAFLIAVFVLSFLVRAYHPVSAPEMWQHRAQVFAGAVSDGNLADTYQSRHPGVVTMAVAGFPIYIYESTPQNLAFVENMMRWAAPPAVTSHGWDMVVGIAALALVVSALIVLVVWSLYRLSSWHLAIAGAVMLSLSPMFLTGTRVFHVNGMQAALMLASAFLLLLYTHEGRRRHFVLSAVFGGLAILNKTPSLFLVPYVGLVLGQKTLRHLIDQWPEQTSSRAVWLTGEFGRRVALPLIIWMLIALAMFALWPAMWLSPIETFIGIFVDSLDHLDNPYSYFVLGQMTEGHPGISYYTLVMIYMVSFVTWPLVIFSIVAYTSRSEFFKRPVPPLIYLAMVEFVVFFFAELSISAKQSNRYLIPSLAMLALVAAVGLISAARSIAASWPAHRRKIVAGVVGATLALHGAAVLSMFPDIGVYRNHLLGGVPAAYRVLSTGSGQQEGAFLAYKYINQHNPPDAELAVPHFRVGRFLTWYTVDETYMSNKATEDTDWYLFDATYRQRGYEPKVQKVWEEFEDRPPHWAYYVDGFLYYRVYAADDAASAPQVTVRRGGRAFIVIAWLWLVALIAALVIAARRHRSDG